MAYPNRTYKDTLFRHLFGSPGCEPNALELYNALAGTSYDDPREIVINTLEDAVFLGRRNDVSFLLGDVLSLWEHQSTVASNMPLRFLQYVARVYSGYMDAAGADLYGGKVLLPTPRLAVFYNGERPWPGDGVLRLSDSFAGGPGDLEVVARVIDVNEGSGESILELSETLRGYAHLVALVRRYGKTRPARDAAVAAAEQCIREGVLADYLTKHLSEVIDMCLTAEEDAKFMRIHEEHVARKAREEGREEGELSMLARLVRGGLVTARDAAAQLGMSAAEVERLVAGA